MERSRTVPRIYKGSEANYRSLNNFVRRSDPQSYLEDQDQDEPVFRYARSVKASRSKQNGGAQSGGMGKDSR